MDFTDMSNVLNYWINSSYNAIPCEMWKVEEIQQLQALLYIAKESEFDNIYQETQDNRRLRNHILEVIFAMKCFFLQIFLILKFYRTFKQHGSV